MDAARAEVRQALAAAFAACSNGQFDSQACQEAHAQAEQVKRQAMQDVSAARRQFQQDVHAAVDAFKASLAPLKGTFGHGGDAAGDQPSGAH
jgi:hypothetical protein